MNRLLWSLPRWAHNLICRLTDYRLVYRRDEDTYHWEYWPYGQDSKGF